MGRWREGSLKGSEEALLIRLIGGVGIGQVATDDQHIATRERQGSVCAAHRLFLGTCKWVSQSSWVLVDVWKVAGGSGPLRQ